MKKISLSALLLFIMPFAHAGIPNILWITAEDMSANLGCWGDAYAHTPNIDQFAKQSVKYTRAFATAPVCSPARSCLINGVYAVSLGTQHLRSEFPIPDYMTGFPSYLRKAGYYCSNNVKTDYNTSSAGRIIKASWNESSNTAHWRNREQDQPFFSIFNDMTTHQSRSMVWTFEHFRKDVQSKLDPKLRHNPAQAPVPPYYPDTPLVRKTIARYYDCISVMDQHVGQRLKELEEDGLAEDTIVFFYSDHGAGLPRHKRLLHDSGMHVPLLIRFPKKYQHLAPAAPGATVGRLVSFVDFAPTVLSLLDLPIPDYMQGVPFLGARAGEKRTYIYGARDRVDEAYDMARSVRDERYLYIRNYKPHVSYNQSTAYSDFGEIRDEITRLAAEGKLKGPQQHYAGPTRKIEELYDTDNDPRNINNLAASIEHQDTLNRFRRALRDWMADVNDQGFLPEAEVWKRLDEDTPFEMAQSKRRYNQEKTLAAAHLVGKGDEVMSKQAGLLRDRDPAVRYWAAVGLRAQGDRPRLKRSSLGKALDDSCSAVRIEAAGALLNLGEHEEAMGVLIEALSDPDLNTVLHAARTFEQLGEKGRSAILSIRLARQRAIAEGGTLNLFINFSTTAYLLQLGEKLDKPWSGNFR